MNVKIATAEDFKRRGQPFPVELPSGRTVMVKRPDIPTLVMLGTLPAPVLSALRHFEERTTTGAFTGAQLVEEFEAEERDRMLEGWRRYACEAIVEPRFTLDPDIYHDRVAVYELGVMELLAVYNARPPLDVSPAPETARVDLSKLGPEDLEHLRRIVGSADDGRVVTDVVESPAVTGSSNVEYVGR